MKETFISFSARSLSRLAATYDGALRRSVGENTSMKIALLVLLGLVLGALGGAALGIGAGLVWVEFFKTTSFEGYSGMLVFFTFMPLGAAIAGLRGARFFCVIAMPAAELPINPDPPRLTV